MTSMSLVLIARQPRILDPSNPRPSVKISSLYSVSVVVKCCQEPGRSVNLKSTSFTSWSLIILLTSEAVFFFGIGGGGGGVGLGVGGGGKFLINKERKIEKAKTRGGRG